MRDGIQQTHRVRIMCAVTAAPTANVVPVAVRQLYNDFRLESLSAPLLQLQGLGKGKMFGRNRGLCGSNKHPLTTSRW